MTSLSSPAGKRWIPWAAVALTLPTLVFVMVNAIEWAAGNDGGVGVFGTSLDRWRGPLNALVGLGPFGALLLILVAGVRVHARRIDGGFEAQVHVRLSGRLLVLALASLVLALAVTLYLVTENAAGL